MQIGITYPRFVFRVQSVTSRLHRPKIKPEIFIPTAFVPLSFARFAPPPPPPSPAFRASLEVEIVWYIVSIFDPWKIKSIHDRNRNRILILFLISTLSFFHARIILGTDPLDCISFHPT